MIGNWYARNEKKENALVLWARIEMHQTQRSRSLAQNKKECKETRKAPTHIDFSGMRDYPLLETVGIERDPE